MVGCLTGSGPETVSERTAGIKGVVVSTVLAWCYHGRAESRQGVDGFLCCD